MPGYEEQHGTIMADEAERDTRDASNGQTARKADDGWDGHDEQQIRQDAVEAQEKLAALLRDLDALHTYLTQRGRHTYDLAQAFLENARRNTDSRAFDERQATMLEYQHSISSDMNAALWWLFAKAPTAKAVPTAITPIAQTS